MKNNTLLFDCDDVCIDLLSCWLKELNLRYNINYTPNDIKGWHLENYIKEINKDEILSVLFDNNFFKKIEPIPGAVKYLHKLKDEGYNIKIVTASYVKSLPAKMDKFFEIFPFLEWKDIIIATDKSIIAGDIMVDDHYDNLINNSYVKYKLLYAKTHNSCYHNDNNIIVINNWEDIYNFIHKIAEVI